ncbi:hypothetical protein BC833DRAFT_569090, partial [Globomyces pollinis-pini]
LQEYSRINLVSTIAYKIRKCPSLAKEIYSIWPGTDYDRTNIECFSDDGQVIVDIELIDRICSLNAFHADNQKYTKEEDSPTGLWILPSFFNHSCIDNAQRGVFRGDVMIITAKQYISKGEEVTMSLMSCLAQRYQQTGQIQEAVSVLEENFRLLSNITNIPGFIAGEKVSCTLIHCTNDLSLLCVQLSAMSFQLGREVDSKLWAEVLSRLEGFNQMHQECLELKYSK